MEHGASFNVGINNLHASFAYRVYVTLIGA